MHGSTTLAKHNKGIWNSKEKVLYQQKESAPEFEQQDILPDKRKTKHSDAFCKIWDSQEKYL